MSLLSFTERHQLPIWDDPNDTLFHRVEIDETACDGCKLCTVVCPANVLELVGEKGDKKSRVIADQYGCVSCNNCLAVCHTRAIRATQPYEFAGYYRRLDRGEFSPPRKF